MDITRFHLQSLRHHNAQGLARRGHLAGPRAPVRYVCWLTKAPVTIGL